jgi:hypothetical protein
VRSIGMVVALTLAAACTAEVDQATPPPTHTDAPPGRERTPEPPANRERDAAPPIDPVDLPTGGVVPSPGCPVEQPFMCAVTAERFECRLRPCPASCVRTGCPSSFVCADCGSGPACVRASCR